MDYGQAARDWCDAETAAIMDMNVYYYSQRMGIVMTEKGETMRDLTQLNKVEKYLKAKNIPYEREDKEDKLVSIERDGIHYVVYEQMEFHQICVPSRERRDWDVICHRGSYGAERGLLEIMGTIVRPCGDSVEGWLTADDVIARIEEKRK